MARRGAGSGSTGCTCRVRSGHVATPSVLRMTITVNGQLQLAIPAGRAANRTQSARPRGTRPVEQRTPSAHQCRDGSRGRVSRHAQRPPPRDHPMPDSGPGCTTGSQATLASSLGGTSPDTTSDTPSSPPTSTRQDRARSMGVDALPDSAVGLYGAHRVTRRRHRGCAVLLETSEAASAIVK